MSGDEVGQRCVQQLPLLPSRVSGSESGDVWSQFQARDHAGCHGVDLDLDWFVTRTVPCPPPQNLCVFWEVVERRNITDTLLSLVRRTCAIPDYYQCSNEVGDSVLPSTHLTESCDSVCKALVGVFATICMIVAGASILWKYKTKKTYKELWSGVFICFGKVFINKRGLNRTESRSPTLDTDESKKEEHSIKRRYHGYVNQGVTVDFRVEKVEFKRTLGDDSSDAGDYETLREGMHLDRQSVPAPDVTLVTNFQRDDEKRLSDC